jgi:hypothetical protein
MTDLSCLEITWFPKSHQCLPLGPILRQFNPVHIHRTYFHRIYCNIKPLSWSSKWLHYKRWLYSDTNLCIPHWTPLHAGDLGPMPHQACHWCLQTLGVPYIGTFITGATGQVEPIGTEAWFNIECGALVPDECCNWTQKLINFWEFLINQFLWLYLSAIIPS